MKRTGLHRLASSTALGVSLGVLSGAAAMAQTQDGANGSVLVASAGGEAAATTVAAAPAAEPAEIIVTGQFRREKLERTPLSITSVSGQTLENKGIQNVRDVAPTVPGLYLAPAALTHSTASYFIRGIGESDSIANQTVVNYVDDVYTARPIGGSFELNDIDSIQVLRGPQGTLYGRNSSAGAIVVTTRLPTDTFTGFAELGGGNYNAFTAKLGVSGPILPGKLDGSISAIYRTRDGLVHDATLNANVGNLDSKGVRAKLNFTPTSWASYLLTFNYFQDDSDPTPLIGRLKPNGTPNTDPNTNYSNVGIFNHTKLSSISLRQTYNLGRFGTLEVISAEGQFKQPGLYDQDGSIAQINETFSNHRDLDYSQEFRYIYDGDRLHVSSGVFLLYDNFRSYRTNYSPLAVNALITPAVSYYTPVVPSNATPGHTSLQNSGEVTKNGAVYGQATYDITRALHLTLGDRYTIEQHTFSFQGNNFATGSTTQLVNNTFTIYPPSQTWSSTTPKVDIDYNITPAVTAYAYFAEGFKAGGFDGRAPNIIDASHPYQPEFDTTYEAGLKTQFFHRTVTANVALFHNDVKGYQTTTTDVTGISHRINLDQVRTQGFELETAWRPIADLTWVNNVSYLDTSIVAVGSKAATTVAAQITGKQIPYAPKWQYYSSIDYKLPLHFYGAYRLGAEFIYRSGFYVDLPNTKAAAGVEQHIVNLSADFVPDGDTHLDFSLNVTNALNDRFTQGGLVGNGITTSNSTTFNDPRLFYARVRYTY